MIASTTALQIQTRNSVDTLTGVVRDLSVALGKVEIRLDGVETRLGGAETGLREQMHASAPG